MKVVTLHDYLKPGDSQIERIREALKEIYSKNKIEQVIKDRKTGETFFIVRG